MLTHLDHKSVTRWVAQFRGENTENFLSRVDTAILQLLRLKSQVSEGKSDLEKWSTQEFCAYLKRMYPVDPVSVRQELLPRLKDFKLKLRIDKQAQNESEILRLIEIIEACDQEDIEKNEAAAVKQLISDLHKQEDTFPQNVAVHLGYLNTSIQPQTLQHFIIGLFEAMQLALKAIQDYTRWKGPIDVSHQQQHQPYLSALTSSVGKHKEHPEGTDNTNLHTSKKSKPTEQCKTCGRNNHTSANCSFNIHGFDSTKGHWHPNINITSLPWAQSPMGKAWAEKGLNKVPANHNLKGEEVQIPPESPLRRENLLLKQNSNKASSSSTSEKRVSHSILIFFLAYTLLILLTS